MRPAGLAAHLHLFPDDLCPATDRYVRATLVANAISLAVYSLGYGPYGRASHALFGLRVDTRGRKLKDRRRAAADELDIAVSTWRRHYEREVLADVATAMSVQV